MPRDRAFNYCNGGGYIVGPSYKLPDDPTEYCYERDIIGCNNLVCGTCHAKLRSVASFSLRLPTVIPASEVYDADWSARGWLEPGGGRTYVCRCYSLLELGAKPSNQLLEVSGIVWECAGHEPSPLPLEIDGHQLTRFTDLPKLLRAAGMRTIKLPWSKIHGRLRGTPLQASFERVVQTFLTDTEPTLRRMALGFYWSHPTTAGATTVLTLAEGDRALFRGVPDGGLSEGKDLEARLILTLGQLWMNDVVDEERARAQLRAEAQRAGRLRPTLASLAAKDTEWLVLHAEALLRGSPEQLGKLIVELEQVLVPHSTLIELAKRARPPVADILAAARKDVETYVTSELREPLLGVLSESQI